MGFESDARIRKAVEQIIGQPLPQRCPEDALPPGARVRVIQDYGWHGPWQREFFGTISDMAAPEPVNNPRAFVGELKYWVDFDEPQYDADAEGPFRKAQIWGRYLQAEGDDRELIDHRPVS
jgi:hypothetical protein